VNENLVNNLRYLCRSDLNEKDIIDVLEELH